MSLFDDPVSRLIERLSDPTYHGGDYLHDPLAWDLFYNDSLDALTTHLTDTFEEEAALAEMADPFAWAKPNAATYAMTTLASILMSSVRYSREQAGRMEQAALKEGLSRSEMFDNLQGFLSQHWNETILPTETARAQATAAVRANAGDPQAQFMWVLSASKKTHCPLCENRHGIVAKVWDDPPPIHVSCGCKLKRIKPGDDSEEPADVYPDFRPEAVMNA